MPGGRPRIEIDKKTFENLCGIFCTLEEIAGVFNCSTDTIERWCMREYKESFADVYKKRSAKGKMSLRRNQLKLSEHNAAMAIWLGKQYLDQKDSVEYEDKEAITRLDAILNGIVDKAKSETE